MELTIKELNKITEGYNKEETVLVRCSDGVGYEVSQEDFNKVSTLKQLGE